MLAAAGLRRLGFASRISLALPADGVRAGARPGHRRDRDRDGRRRASRDAVARINDAGAARRARRRARGRRGAGRRLPDADRRAGVAGGRRRRSSCVAAVVALDGSRAVRGTARGAAARRRGARRARRRAAARRRRRRDPRGGAARARQPSKGLSHDARIVYLIGAGPGDPGLITVRGLQCLASADVVLYDHLVHAAPAAPRAAGRGEDRRRRRRAAAARAGSDLLSARREGARGQDRRAPEVGRSVRLRSAAAPKRCSCTSRACASRSCPAFPPASRRRATRACRSPIRAAATR